jgi:hypothetical protein
VPVAMISVIMPMGLGAVMIVLAVVVVLRDHFGSKSARGNRRASPPTLY